jgi:hypothetical protein
VDPGDTNGSAINLILNCQTDDGSTSTTAVELDVGDNVDSAGEVLSAPGTLRPPLSGDPMSYTQEQIVAAGFPPRRDPNQSPAAYNNWLRLTSKAATRVDSKPVDLHRQNVSSINWSGSVTTAALTFEMVQGEGYVPAVTGAVPTYCGTNVWNESSMWAGLDGAATNDLIQDGTEQYVESVREVTCTTYYLKTYDAFIEYWSTSGNN